jgi:hypothetical protein
LVRRCTAHDRIGCQDYTCIAADTAHHSRGHEHRWADDGGHLPPGDGEAVNTTSRGEPILTPDQYTEIARGVTDGRRDGYYLLSAHGRFFATRVAGAHIRGLIETAIPAGPIVVRLDGVEAVTGAFADELFGELFVRHGRRLQVVGGYVDVSETVATALQRRSG